MKRGLLATERELTGLRDRLGRKPYDHIYDTLRKRCALILESQPITETMWRSAHQQGRWGAATAAVASLQGRIFDLLVCHRVDPNSAYRDRALEELKNLVSFSTWVDPSHNDLSADLSETNNVAAQHPDVVAKIEAYLKTARTPSDVWKPRATRRRRPRRPKPKPKPAAK